MRTTLVVSLGVALVALAALFAFGVISLDGGTDTGDPAIEPDDEGGDPEGGQEEPALRQRTPEEQPPLVALPLDEDVEVLFLVGVPEKLNATLAKFWHAKSHVNLTTWTAPPPDTAGGGVPPGTVLPGHWEGPLTGGTLGEKGIDAVVVHGLDPADVPNAFWDDLHDKVRGGQVGLMVMATHLVGERMLKHVAFRRMLPVRTAHAIEGPELPGIYRQPVPFMVTEAGEKHPATRLVPWPSWSRRIWASKGAQENPWNTPFCYPVKELVEGAVTLLTVEPLTGECYPAMVAAPDRIGRVLWVGFTDMGPPGSHRDPAVVDEWNLLAGNWVVWLAGKA